MGISHWEMRKLNCISEDMQRKNDDRVLIFYNKTVILNLNIVEKNKDYLNFFSLYLIYEGLSWVFPVFRESSHVPRG